jgi:hypothetical protein
MNGLREFSKFSYAKLNFALVFVVELVRIVVIARLPDSGLVQHVPDDAFYYLQAARNFSRLGRWTFDGVEPSSGFHLFWGYFLAGIFWIHPDSSVHFLFFIGSFVQSLCLAVAAYLLTKTAERFGGPSAFGGVLLVFLSAYSLLQGTWMMESPLVIVAGAAILYLTTRIETEVTTSMLAAAFLLGILASLCRSDSGLLAFWLFVAQVYLWRRGVSNIRMAAVAALVFLGASIGVVATILHTHWVSGQWAQASAQEKFLWSKTEGRSFHPVSVLFRGIFNPFTNLHGLVPRSLHINPAIHITYLAVQLVLFLIISAGLVTAVRAKRHPATAAFVSAVVLTLLSYFVFYRYDSASVQPWYVANLQAPTALLAGIGMAWMVRRHSATALSGIAAICVCSIPCSFYPSFPWQETFLRSGLYLRSNPSIQPVGAWNAGILEYFSGREVVNLDGLMNDSILPYVKTGDLAKYLVKRNIKYAVDFNNVWITPMNERGGYANGSLERCIESRNNPFPDDPDNYFNGAYLEFYKIDLSCAAASPGGSGLAGNGG